MHALIRNNAIVLSGPLPHPTWPDPETGRWWDMRDPAQVAEAGWVEVTVQPRPDDTATTTWDRDEPRLIAGVPTVRWVERDKTAEELAADAQAATAQTLTADAAADLPRLEQALTDTLTLLGPNDQAGSIRHHRTTVLTNQYQVAAQRSQDDLILTLAVIVRRLVRQQIRDTRLQTGTLDSADVGPDAT